MITAIIIAVAITALVAILASNHALRDKLAAANSTKDFERDGRKHFESITARALEQHDEVQKRAAALEKANADQRDRILELQRELEAHRKPRAARMTVEGGMPDEAIAETLNGAEASPLMKAVFAYLSAKIVTLADRATDAPRETREAKGETIAGYSSEQRLHDAGGASYIAEVLAEFQEMARSKDSSATERAT